MDNRLLAALSGHHDNYIAPFLWLHNEDDALILRELERIYACGIRAVCLESRTHEQFCREDWWSDCRLILDFCRAHDMKVWILDDKHFPSGYANGIYEQHPELVQWNITERHVDVAGPVSEGCVIADGWISGDDELLGVYACRHIPDSRALTGEIYDITSGLSDGNVYFDLPEGAWRIVFLIKTRKGLNARNRHYSDKLSFESTDAYLREVYDAHYEHLSDYFGNTLLGFFSDEPGFGNNTAYTGMLPIPHRIHFHHPWHACVHEYFTALYGDNALRNLLALWFDFDGIPYMDYRVAYMNFITDRYAEAFTGRIADWCHDHGVAFIGHVIEDNGHHYRTTHSAGHYFKALRAQDMAGIDVVLHQIVPGLSECNNAASVSYLEADSRFFHNTLAKLGSSLAHITPHMKGRAMCEIFGAYGWAEGTRIMKYLCDHMLVRGINYFVPHAFSPKENDPDCPPNFYATGENPQYKYFSHIMDYMNRVCHLFDGSTHVNTCAVLYDAEHVWSGVAHLPLDRLTKTLMDHGLDFDILPVESLADIDKDGNLCGEHYDILLVPACDYMRLAVRDTLRDLLRRTGIQVILVTETPASDFDFVAAPLDDIAALVRRMGGGDIDCTPATSRLRYRHATRDGLDLYLFVNEDTVNTLDTTVTLRDFAGPSYIQYDPMDNTATVIESDTVHLTLPPYGATLILIGDTDVSGLPAPVPAPAMTRRVLCPTFSVSIKERDTDDFRPYREMTDLVSLTARGEMPRFSGFARYTATLSLAGDRPTTLDLGDVGETAEVYLNGQYVGLRLLPPFRFDLSAHIRPGDNELTVVTSNPLGHRIRDSFSRYLLLPPVGLLGPICVEEATTPDSD